MNAACTDFRAQLARLLSGRVAPRAFDELSWHEHLLACGACRELLAQEHALDELLASLPSPKLPPELARRVLAKLEPEREAALDRLLELSTTEMPPGLARQVLAGLAHERTVLAGAQAGLRDERALDRLLERVPAPRVPADLAARVIAKARFERARELANTNAVQRGPGQAQKLARPVRRLALAAGLALTLGLGSWWLGTRSHERRDELAIVAPVNSGTQPINNADSALDEPSPELLAALDLLESWELVASDDLDVQLNALDNLDELFLSVETEADSGGDAAPDNAPKKG